MLHLFCALKCEANPLLRHYELYHLNTANLFPVYMNRDNSISLTITGTGKIAAASAAMYTHMLLNGRRDHIWLNIGIAGHADLMIGQAMLANKITDKSTGRNWYPQLVFRTDIMSAPLITLDTPSDSYDPHCLFDMEAAGFYDSVSRFGTAELCHSLKIVSDNAQNHLKQISAAFVAELISTRLTQIDALIAGLSDLTQQSGHVVDEDEIFTRLVAQWHFTRTQRNQLKDLLRRWQILLPDTPLLTDAIHEFKSSRQFLAGMNARLDQVPVRFGKAHCG